MENICSEIKKLDNMITRKVISETKLHNNVSLSQVQLNIMKYILQNQDKEIYQKDIEQTLSLRRSTVSDVLKTMEKHDLILRSTSLLDNRSKQVILTKKSIKRAKEIKNRIIEFNNLVETGISEKDLQVFFKVTNQIKENLR